MIIVIHAILLALVSLCGLAVALTRNPLDQTIVFSFYGALLTVLFFSLHAPDVAFSELVVGSAALPLMLLVTLGKLKQERKK
jgi:uncharacterized MnhB-related membrane protein